uniref:Uncharacterized protein n=1 Tax=Chenopodium quinoa TaxID=63459 RepID=A0A803MN28_CHEQI
MHEGNCGLKYNRLGINAARQVTRNAPTMIDPSARAPALWPSTLEIVKPTEYFFQKPWFLKRDPLFLFGPEEQAVAVAAPISAGVFAVGSEQNVEQTSSVAEPNVLSAEGELLLKTSLRLNAFSAQPQSTTSTPTAAVPAPVAPQAQTQITTEPAAVATVSPLIDAAAAS